ncbi:hypothetical protein GON09_005091 [Rhodococcus sp. B50]|nr:hypothetical protein [Rhodococcus sp. B50]
MGPDGTSGIGVLLAAPVEYGCPAAQVGKYRAPRRTSSAASNLDVRWFARPDLPSPLHASSPGRIEKALRGDAATRSPVESPNADVQDVFVSHKPMTLPSVSLK